MSKTISEYKKRLFKNDPEDPNGIIVGKKKISLDPENPKEKECKCFDQKEGFKCPCGGCGGLYTCAADCEGCVYGSAHCLPKEKNMQDNAICNCPEGYPRHFTGCPDVCLPTKELETDKLNCDSCKSPVWLNRLGQLVCFFPDCKLEGIDQSVRRDYLSNKERVQTNCPPPCTPKQECKSPFHKKSCIRCGRSAPSETKEECKCVPGKNWCKVCEPEIAKSFEPESEKDSTEAEYWRKKYFGLNPQESELRSDILDEVIEVIDELIATIEKEAGLYKNRKNLEAYRLRIAQLRFTKDCIEALKKENTSR